MKKRIFQSVTIVAFFAVVLTVALSMGVMYAQLQTQVQQELRDEASYISQAVESGGVDYLKGINEKRKRITLIDADGTVIYDSIYQIGKMQNHNDREEVVQARENGAGESSRYSDTMSTVTTYYAVLLSNDTVLRVADSRDSVVRQLLRVVKPMIAVVIAVLVAAACIASFVSKKIVKPLNELDLEHPSDEEGYDEIAPLLKKIHQQSGIIKRQISDAKRSQREFEEITKRMQEGILVMDSRYEVLSYNKAALDCLCNGEEQRGKNVFVWNRSKEFREVLQSAMEGNTLERILKLGERSFQIHGSPVMEENEVLGVVVLTMDVTEKQQREMLRREFTANVSHELKTPLTSITGFAELLKGGFVQEEDKAEFAANIYSEAQRLIELVNDIIRVSALEDTQIVYDTQQIDLYELAFEMQQRLEQKAQKMDVSIEIKGENVPYEAPKKIVKDILYNLMENAIKYNRIGGSVKVEVGEANGKRYVCVSDQGIGIAKAEQERVFERFYRVDKSHSTRVEGTGLGLAIVKHSVEYLKGDIRLESALGEGTAITVWL